MIVRKYQPERLEISDNSKVTQSLGDVRRLKLTSVCDITDMNGSNETEQPSQGRL